MIPIVAGLLMGAAMGGGIAALQKKDILQGALLGGIGGAVGGAFMPAVAGAAPGVAAGSAPGLAAGAGTGITTGATGAAGITTGASGSGLALPSLATTTGAGGAGTGIGGIGNFLSANKYALAGGVAGGMMAPGEAPPSPEQGNIRDYTFSQTQNPNFGAPGENYYSQQSYAPGAVTPVEDYNMANGGIIALADGGEIQRYTQPQRTMDPAVAAYNTQMMERANQQYNVNARPGPNQVPGSVGYVAPRMSAPAPAAGTPNDSISGLSFNPVTQQYEGEFAAPGAKKNKNDFDYEDLDARYASREQYEEQGAANGGLMSSYAEGGISNLGGYSDGGQLLKGPGDGVSDSIPARIGAKQPARLSGGEFVVPARMVGELGQGSTDAGAKQLYAMMDRIQNARRKTTGKGKVAVDTNPRRLLPA